MNSAQDILDLKPRALSGVLVCDALMLRGGTIGSYPTQISSLLADGHRVILVNTKGRK
jgi:hypothetical protein